MTKYIALTGATGLLGSYLLKDLLVAGCNVAVLIRKSRTEDVRGRIESILHRFETRLGFPLPRPIILESDLGLEHLGLDVEAKRWVTRHVDSVLHNAASLEFLSNEKTGEPFRSNVEGTRHVLELCRECSVRQFHHVSTAYVCGLRAGRVLETELNRGQEFGNAYEESKARSENEVRSASFLDRVTVYRPAIIVGDSVTGYTPTYHGFYTPLKILYPLIDGKDVTPEGIRVMLNAIGMNADDEKNFVPVDWISRVMTHVITNPTLHGTCYHLAPADRTRIGAMCDILVKALCIPRKNTGIDPGGRSAVELIETFVSQMDVYRAYWRNDPIFDMTNTEAVAGHLPCPTMNEERMEIMMRYAVHSNFGWPRPKPVEIDFDPEKVLKALSGAHASDAEFKEEDRIGLRVVGPGGGDWTLCSNRSKEYGIIPGLPEDGFPTARMNTTLFRALVEGTVAPVSLSPGDVAWENVDDSWISRHGNSVLARFQTGPK